MTHSLGYTYANRTRDLRIILPVGCCYCLSGPVESWVRPPSCHRCRTTSTIWLEETRRLSKNHLAEENDWGGHTVTEFRGSHGMQEGKGERYLASGRQYGNALLGVCHQEEEEGPQLPYSHIPSLSLDQYQIITVMLGDLYMINHQ